MPPKPVTYRSDWVYLAGYRRNLYDEKANQSEPSATMPNLRERESQRRVRALTETS